MALTDGILRAFRDPRGAMQAEVDRGLTEARALAHLMLACGLFFVASIPRAERFAAATDGRMPEDGAIAGHGFALLVVAPLAFYALAALAHGVARLFGGRGGFLGARAALFWSLLPFSLLTLVVALAGVVAERLDGAAGLEAVRWLAPLAGCWWLWIFAASLAVTEGFRNTGRVLLASSIGGVLVVVGISLAARL